MTLPWNQRTDRAVDLWSRGLFPFQRQIAADTSRFLIWNKSRQIGGSHAISAACIKSGLIEGRPQFILSVSQDLSNDVLTKVRAHCCVLAELGCHEALDLVVDSKTELQWRSGGRVVGRPANRNTARGATGDLWLDEFAFHDDADGIWRAAAPIATRRNLRIRVVSTPNGAIGKFHELFSDPPKGARSISTTIDQAVAEGVNVDVDFCWSLAGGDERVFGEMFRCRFLDADLQYLPTALVDQAFQPAELPDLSRARIRAGLDVARVRDLTVLEIIAERGGHMHRIGERTCKRTKFDVQRRMIDEARRAYRWDTLHVDQTGLGSQLAEELVSDYGDREVFPLDFTPEQKEKMATGVLTRLAGGRLHLAHESESDRELRADMVALRRVVSANGNVSYDVPRTAKGHGDRLWALALSLLGTEIPPVPRGVFTRPVVPVF